MSTSARRRSEQGEHQKLEVLAEKGEEEGRQGCPTPAGLLVRSIVLLGLFALISSAVLELDPRGSDLGPLPYAGHKLRHGHRCTSLSFLVFRWGSFPWIWACGS